MSFGHHLTHEMFPSLEDMDLALKTVDMTQIIIELLIYFNLFVPSIID